MAKKDITEACDRCGGTGFEGGSDPETGDPIQTTCTKCDGNGNLLIGQLDDTFMDDIDTIKDNVDVINDKVEAILDFHGIVL